MDAASLDTHLASAGLQDNNTKTDSVLLDPKQTFEAERDLQESGNNLAYDLADNTNLFGDAVDLDTLAHLEVPDADADSVSVVPSIAQTSELCNVGSTGQSGISVGHVSSGKVDTQTAVEVAARSLRLEPWSLSGSRVSGESFLETRPCWTFTSHLILRLKGQLTPQCLPAVTASLHLHRSHGSVLNLDCHLQMS